MVSGGTAASATPDPTPLTRPPSHAADPTKAASDAIVDAYEGRRAGGAGFVSAALRGRWDAAVYVAVAITPYSALVANLAYVTVEGGSGHPPHRPRASGRMGLRYAAAPPPRAEIALLVRWARRAWRRSGDALEAAAVAGERRGAAPLNLKDVAAELEEADAEAEEGVGALLRRSADLVARGACSVLVESACAGLGTLLWPGEGTGVLQLLGNVLCYRF